jgi:hypothetical protein
MSNSKAVQHYTKEIFFLQKSVLVYGKYAAGRGVKGLSQRALAVYRHELDLKNGCIPFRGVFFLQANRSTDLKKPCSKVTNQLTFLNKQYTLFL